MGRPGGSKQVEGGEEHGILRARSALRRGQATLLAIWRWRGPLLLGFDLISIALSFVGAYYLRFSLQWITSTIPPSVETTPPVDPYYRVALLASLVWVFLLWKERSYDRALHLSRPLARQVEDVLLTGFYATVFLMVVSFLFRYFLLSRVVYVIAIGLALSALVLLRVMQGILGRYLTLRGIISSRVLLMGWNESAGSLLDRLSKQIHGTEIVGRLGGVEEEGGRPAQIASLGLETDIKAVYRRSHFDQLVVCSHRQGGAQDEKSYPEALINALNFCERKRIPVYMVPDFLDVAVRGREVGTLAGVPFIRLRDSSLHPFYSYLKRVMDVSISFFVLAIGMPAWLLISLLVKLTSKGPVFYVQSRAGLHGRPFHMYKFRSMLKDADQMLHKMVDLDALKEPVFNIRRDPRVTPVGRILRRFSIDEVPQFLNVLRGSLSIVGPRPERVELVHRYDAYQRRRLKAKPGITGYQQVMSRGDPSLARRIEYDLYYLKHQSLFLDLFIMLKTILVVVRGDGVR
jgi:exopolysaccharide biosynthesis polyprenyl glycosylphosphotransferase